MLYPGTKLEKLLEDETSSWYDVAVGTVLQLAINVVVLVVLLEGVTGTGAAGAGSVIVIFNCPKGIWPSKNATTSEPTEFHRIVAE